MTTHGEGNSKLKFKSKVKSKVKSNSNSNRLQHDLQGNRLGGNIKNKGYTSIHANYTPFLKYIENHASIDDATVQRAKAKYGRLSSYLKNNKTNTKQKTIKKMSSAFEASNNNFATQKQSAKTKAELDDERHADLHTNTKTRNYSDKDKIFLLKREIDNLRGTLESTQQQQQQQQTSLSPKSFLGGHTGSSLSLLSALLLFGVVLLAARKLNRKLRWMRAADSLLSSEDHLSSENSGSGSARNYEYHRTSTAGGGDTENGFELRSYEAPSSAATETTVQFV